MASTIKKWAGAKTGASVKSAGYTREPSGRELQAMDEDRKWKKADPLFSKGVAYEKVGKWEEAADAFEVAADALEEVGLVMSAQDIRKRAGKARDQQGNLAKAIEGWLRAGKMLETAVDSSMREQWGKKMASEWFALMPEEQTYALKRAKELGIKVPK